MREKVVTRSIPSFLLRCVYFIADKLEEFEEPRLARKRAELADLQKRIPQVEGEIIRMSALVRGIEKCAGDHGSDAWYARREKRWAEVEGNREFLYRLEAREKKLKHDLGMT